MPKTAKNTAKAKPVTRAARVRTSTEVVIPDEYRPIGMWGYFGYTFLFAIPLIGWIFCVYFALAGSNYNLRNFARSQFCYLIIYIIVICLLAGFGILQTIFQSLM